MHRIKIFFSFYINSDNPYTARPPAKLNEHLTLTFGVNTPQEAERVKGEILEHLNCFSSKSGERIVRLKTEDNWYMIVKYHFELLPPAFNIRSNYQYQYDTNFLLASGTPAETVRNEVQDHINQLSTHITTKLNHLTFDCRTNPLL